MSLEIFGEPRFLTLKASLIAAISTVQSRRFGGWKDCEVNECTLDKEHYEYFRDLAHERYASQNAEMEKVVDFGELIVFEDCNRVGKPYILADGFHRFLAISQVDSDIMIPCKVYQGSLDEAKDYSFLFANIKHGLKRNCETLEKCIQYVCGHSQFRFYSRKLQAEMIGVSDRTFDKKRDPLPAQSLYPQNPTWLDKESLKSWKAILKSGCRPIVYIQNGKTICRSEPWAKSSSEKPVDPPNSVPEASSKKAEASSKKPEAESNPIVTSAPVQADEPLLIENPSIFEEDPFAVDAPFDLPSPASEEQEKPSRKETKIDPKKKHSSYPKHTQSIFECAPIFRQIRKSIAEILEITKQIEMIGENGIGFDRAKKIKSNLMIASGECYEQLPRHLCPECKGILKGRKVLCHICQGLGYIDNRRWRCMTEKERKMYAREIAELKQGLIQDDPEQDEPEMETSDA